MEKDHVVSSNAITNFITLLHFAFCKRQSQKPFSDIASKGYMPVPVFLSIHTGTKEIQKKSWSPTAPSE